MRASFLHYSAWRRMQFPRDRHWLRVPISVSSCGNVIFVRLKTRFQVFAVKVRAARMPPWSSSHLLVFGTWCTLVKERQYSPSFSITRVSRSIHDLKAFWKSSKVKWLYVSWTALRLSSGPCARRFVMISLLFRMPRSHRGWDLVNWLDGLLASIFLTTFSRWSCSVITHGIVPMHCESRRHLVEIISGSDLVQSRK
jgi:hypothetical protein